MTSIEWMSIQGVRSFDPNEKQTIKFFKPLTIILGQNGAGKTTIIECLKNATTGELPPNSNRGKSFIHDPKVDGTTEVKAQIRLQFCAANAKRMVSIRSFSLTQNKKSATFKQLDAVIQTKNQNGETVSRSYKVTEMDKHIPECMGVSKAILENVIFCHQEDVNWPLSESSVLKKKFDDIFASTRYTKALDVISKSKKEQTTEIKLLKSELKLTEGHRNQAADLQKESEKETYKVAQLKNKISKLDSDIAELDVDISKYDSVASSINHYNSELKRLGGAIQGAKKYADEIFKTVLNEEVFEESDAELIQLRNNFVREVSELRKKKEEYEERVTRAKRERDENSSSFNRLQTQLGGLTSLKQNHERRVQELSQEIRNLSNRYQISGYERLNDQSILRFVKELNDKLNEMRGEYQSLKKKHQNEETQLSTELSTTQAKLNNLSSNISKTQGRLSNLNNQVSSIETRIQAVDVTEEQMQKLQTSLDKFDAEFIEKNKQINLEGIDASIRDTEKQISAANQLVKKLSADIKARDTEREIAMRIDELKKQQETAETAIENILNSVRTQFSDLLGSRTIDEQNFGSVVSSIVSEKKTEANKMSMKKQGVDKAISGLKSKIDIYNNQLKNFEEQIERNKKRIAEACPSDRSLFDMIQEVEGQVDDIRSDMSITEALKMCYENFIKRAHDCSKCIICDRGLSHAELETFERLQREKLDKTPALLERKGQELSKHQSLLRKLNELVPLQKQIENLMNSDVPKAKNEKERVAQELQNESEKMDEYSEELANLKSVEERATKLSPFEHQIRAQTQSLTQIKQKIQREQAELSKYAVGNTESFDSLRQQLDGAQSKIEQLNTALANNRTLYRQKQKELSSLNQQKELLKDQFRDKQLKYQSVKQYTEQKIKIEKEIVDVQRELNDLSSSAPSLELAINTLKERLTQLRANHNTAQSNMEKQIGEYQSDISSIDSAVREIRRFVEEGKEEQLEEVQNKIEKVQIKMKQYEEQISRDEEEKNKKSEMLAKQAEIERSIDDNLRYREKTKEVANLEKEMQDIKKKLASITGQSDFNEDDINKKKQKREKLMLEKSQLTGMRTTHKGRIVKIKEDLSNNNFENVEQRYRASLIKLKTTELCQADLEKYYKALDKALMKYHAMKMAEINEMIKELWAKTYRGQDIDTIEIRADHEESGTSTRRQYNYRVVMKKGDVALDMRGRCSAGQKVLACLIIRLALAEAFCIDCGVLALDEPTTNLDIDTIGSLAESLQLIINERRKQANFQLVVITHDEEFVNKLGQGKFIDSYYRVSKDPSTGFSQIEKQSFRDA